MKECGNEGMWEWVSRRQRGFLRSFSVRSLTPSVIPSVPSFPQCRHSLIPPFPHSPIHSFTRFTQFPDPPTPHDLIAVVEHDCLAWRDSELRLVEAERRL
jgi:hypothetical protein